MENQEPKNFADFKIHFDLICPNCQKLVKGFVHIKGMEQKQKETQPFLIPISLN